VVIALILAIKKIAYCFITAVEWTRLTIVSRSINQCEERVWADAKIRV